MRMDSELTLRPASFVGARQPNRRQGTLRSPALTPARPPGVGPPLALMRCRASKPPGSTDLSPDLVCVVFNRLRVATSAVKRTRRVGPTWTHLLSSLIGVALHPGCRHRPCRAVVGAPPRFRPGQFAERTVDR